MKKNKLSSFKKEMQVRYIPNHAYGDINHSDCENGIVKNVGTKFVFVNFIRNGILQETAQAVDPNNLIIWN